jgi:type I restriction-modification system DNA methylase subunit
LAALLAPLCRMLREEVQDALRSPSSAFAQLAKDWRDVLFSDADDDRFADAYAQTVTFALLLARSEGARTLDEDLHDAVQKLAADHLLLSRALQVLTDPAVRSEIAPPLRLLQRVIDRVLSDALHGRGGADPWLYFYEDFLAEYDPDLRKDAGAYYTPTQVVRAQVRLIDRLLTDKLGRKMGFAEPTVITLDPAVGTGPTCSA